MRRRCPRPSRPAPLWQLQGSSYAPGGVGAPCPVPARPPGCARLCLPRALAAAAAAGPLGSGPGTPSAAGEGALAGSARGPAWPGLPLRWGAAEPAARRPPRPLPALPPRSAPPRLPPPPSLQPSSAWAHPPTARAPLRTVPASRLGPRLPSAPSGVGLAPLDPRPAGRTGKAWPWPAPGPALQPHLAPRPDKGGQPGALRDGARGAQRLEVRRPLSSPPPCRRTRRSAAFAPSASHPGPRRGSPPPRPPTSRRPRTFLRADTVPARALAALSGVYPRPLSSALAFSFWDPVSLCLSVSESLGGLSDLENGLGSPPPLEEASKTHSECPHALMPLSVMPRGLGCVAGNGELRAPTPAPPVAPCPPIRPQASALPQQPRWHRAALSRPAQPLFVPTARFSLYWQEGFSRLWRRRFETRGILGFPPSLLPSSTRCSRSLASLWSLLDSALHAVPTSQAAGTQNCPGLRSVPPLCGQAERIWE